MPYVPFPVTPTRYAKPAQYDLGVKTQDACAIGYGQQFPGCWRFVVSNPDACVVGPQYRTKAELLADLPRYATSWGL